MGTCTCMKEWKIDTVALGVSSLKHVQLLFTVLNAAHLTRMGVAKSTGKHSVTVSSYVKLGLKANKAGRRETVAEFSTVPPKSGQLTPMVLAL